MDQHEAIQAHLDRQADAPEGTVRLDNGKLRPVGGTSDNASPPRGSKEYLPDPEWAKE